MALEDLTGSTKYIDDLVNTNPTATDDVSEGDDHIRGIKNVLGNTFQNITGPITATQAELNLLDGVTATTAELNILDGVTATTAELNYCDGVTSNIQTQLDAKFEPKMCAVYRTANLTSTGNIPWTSEAYDDDSMHSTVSNTDKLVVPAGVTRVRLSFQGQCELTSSLSTGNSKTYVILNKNGTNLTNPDTLGGLSTHYMTASESISGGHYFMLQFDTVVNCSPGDEFGVYFLRAANVTLLDNNTFFRMETLPA